ncbi:hypothetical protein AACH06_16700 [Ideonella sp. DXS29W]|uniref:SH3 domain-containing protein n=1 Tax=Ideonella lacteola TaxID=2984193 RepID=A0ABU9BRK0_9BURK
MITTAAVAALSSLALVTQDATPLRAAPSDGAPAQAQLWPGDALEVRGERLGYLQVWDHKRERGGYVKATQVRGTDAKEADAPELLAVLRFVKDTPGAESLGIAYAAAYLKAAPARDIGPEAFDAIGTMAERLARRATSRSATLNATISAHLDSVGAYGVRWSTFEREGAVQLCYDGDAFRRVLAMPQSTPEQQARAVLSLTRHDCVDPALKPTEREAHDRWRADLLDKLSSSSVAALPEWTKNKLRLRRAGVWSALAFAQARRGDSAQAAGQRAVDELAAVRNTELAEEDQAEYNDAAIRVGASRWAAMPAANAVPDLSRRPTLITQAGEPGETCLLLVDAQHDAKKPLLRRCTWGVVWLNSATADPGATTLTLAVQPLATWRELWVLRKAGAEASATDSGWTIDVLPPAPGNPMGADAGYVEYAGFAPGTEPKLLLARESRTDGRWSRRFEVARLPTLTTDKFASTPQILAAFQRYQDAGWKRSTVSLR